MPKRKTADDYHALAGDNFEWLGKEAPMNHNIKTIWRCKERHVFYKSYLDMYKHRSCPLCKPFRKVERDYLLLAAKKKLEWLGSLPTNVRGETVWKCLRCGRVRSASYMLIQRHSGCPQCGREKFISRIRLTEQDYHNLAGRAGLIFAGPTVKSNRDRTNWQCRAKGHKLFLSYHSIARLIDRDDGVRHRPCRQCYLEHIASLRRKTPEDYRNLAQERNMEWIGPFVGSVNTKTYWKAKCGHIIHSSWSLVLNSSGLCPNCSAKNRGAYHRLTANDYHRHAAAHGFDWVGKDLPETSRAITRWRCTACAGEFERSLMNVYPLRRCPLCGNRQRKTEHDYHRLAEERGLLWSGNFLPSNTVAKTRWFHLECRQEFEQNYQQIQAGVGCPNCKNIINGCLASRPQLALSDAIERIWETTCRINETHAGINVDIVAEVDGWSIAIFYDGSTWHSSDTVQARDKNQTDILLENGWTVWRVLSDTLIPGDDEIASVFQRIISGSERLIITQLKDWRSRPPIAERLHPDGGQ